MSQVGLNVLKCLGASGGVPPPVRLGASGPWRGSEAPQATHFHGLDGLGDATPKIEAELMEDAVPKLLELLREAKDVGAEVTVVTLGGSCRFRGI